ncbi:DoxX family protein [Corynebacterium breve]|uniref:DoxX family protein n=1 Tax=Corynebacterium breve TaxID=3049799 RepID=A0ABY8VFK2_9CORY|nr:DoxX family protein [Corynebacterium breve]WIM68431.1 DoxX family protein [Corynebacterium breve]
MNRPVVRDLTLLIVRIVLGVVFVARGYTHWFVTGIGATAGEFARWGIPQPKLSAYLASGTELIAGALLVIGLLTTLVASALALLIALATYFVHLGNGFFVADGGIEYPLVLFVSLLMIVVFGAGRASLDEVLNRA